MVSGACHRLLNIIHLNVAGDPIIPLPPSPNVPENMRVDVPNQNAPLHTVTAQEALADPVETAKQVRMECRLSQLNEYLK
jgi:hypothetical protein